MIRAPSGFASIDDLNAGSPRRPAELGPLRLPGGAVERQLSKLPGASPLPPVLVSPQPPRVESDDPTKSEIDDDSAHEGEDTQQPPLMPDCLWRTLQAEARRRAEPTDGITLAQDLIERYTRARALSDTWGLVTGFEKRRKLTAVITMTEAAQRARIRRRVAPEPPPPPAPEDDPVKRQMVRDALEVAVDGAKADRRVLEKTDNRVQDDSSLGIALLGPLVSMAEQFPALVGGAAKQSTVGIVDLPKTVDETIAALEEELEATKKKIRWCPPNPCVSENERRTNFDEGVAYAAGGKTAKVAPTPPLEAATMLDNNIIMPAPMKTSQPAVNNGSLLSRRLMPRGLGGKRKMARVAAE